MRFYTSKHQFYCGNDLHARTMYLCIMDQSGKVLLHRNCREGPEEFLRAVSPYREDIGVAVECIFTWYRIADLCAREGMDFVLGHALYERTRKPSTAARPGTTRSTPGKSRPLFEAGCSPWLTSILTQCVLLEKRIDRRSNRAGIGARFADPAVRTDGCPSAAYDSRCGENPGPGDPV
jgi:hypothetical protein